MQYYLFPHEGDKIGLLSEQILDAVHVEGKRETERLVEGIALSGGDDVTDIEGENAHAESATDSEVFAVTLRLALMVVASANRELVVIDVLCTDAPLYFFQFFFEASRSIAETGKDTLDAGHIAVLTTHTVLIV